MAQQLLTRPTSLPDVWSQFTHTLEPVEFSRGAVILPAGARTNTLYVLRSGKAKTTCSSADGKELLLDFHASGDVLAEPTLFDAGPCATTTTAMTRIEAGQIALGTLHKWLVMCPEITEHLLGTMARRHRERHQMRMDLVQIDAPARLAKALLRLAGRVQRLVIEDVTQQELGQYIGSGRDTVNKILADFAQRGWIVIERRTILLTDTAALGRRSRH
ncbi:Crp/Fnr family transcriptional regulator [Lentzea sp. NBRC 105346]|uniref:Crp/Fnr family transcriptional regulator n=1 Tax=Lentzea sp. NBRC 105346 TaxID=3032205 RepID=UPI0024A46334|nr:Crp/Fnr family transcriptional regulator [Lentzea sp. NBRC 105346]GLZ29002.1 Crp/Fnr family transcriptional regulator [Lentzea sp. NBRC 105346]